MNTKKTLPPKLQQKQELKKQESINKVLRAIHDIKNEGRKVSITTLVEFTGLSRSVFSKPHIRELLVDYGYTQKGAVTDNSSDKKKTKKSSDKDKIIDDLRARNANLERECQLLRGRLYLLMGNQ
ncbi:DUF6262 family protein [Bengtsoniella intestinalis]|uniref:DUF6262 family protein n=1 Tax=Bengtsoniella intestinalis TaxID=3073143 RepID=UPI00391F0B80